MSILLPPPRMPGTIFTTFVSSGGNETAPCRGRNVNIFLKHEPHKVMQGVCGKD